MEQKRFTVPGPVLDAQGRPVPGYSTRSVLHYDRSAIKASPFRIKEWDFYQVSDLSLIHIYGGVRRGGHHVGL